MQNFDTATEEAFYNLMQARKILCKKLKTSNIPIADFLCCLNGYKIIFELKNLEESRTTRWYGKSMLIRSNTIPNRIKSNMVDCKKKFLNPLHKNLPSAMVIINTMKLTIWEIDKDYIEDALRQNIGLFPEIGNIVLAGYNKPSNSILALHYYENKFSKRVVDRSFFERFNSKLWSL